MKDTQIDAQATGSDNQRRLVARLLTPAELSAVAGGANHYQVTGGGSGGDPGGNGDEDDPIFSDGME